MHFLRDYDEAMSQLAHYARHVTFKSAPLRVAHMMRLRSAFRYMFSIFL